MGNKCTSDDDVTPDSRSAPSTVVPTRGAVVDCDEIMFATRCNSHDEVVPSAELGAHDGSVQKTEKSYRIGKRTLPNKVEAEQEKRNASLEQPMCKYWLQTDDKGPCTSL